MQPEDDRLILDSVFDESMALTAISSDEGCIIGITRETGNQINLAGITLIYEQMRQLQNWLEDHPELTEYDKERNRQMAEIQQLMHDDPTHPHRNAMFAYNSALPGMIEDLACFPVPQTVMPIDAPLLSMMPRKQGIALPTHKFQPIDDLSQG